MICHWGFSYTEGRSVGELGTIVAGTGAVALSPTLVILLEPRQLRSALDLMSWAVPPLWSVMDGKLVVSDQASLQLLGLTVVAVVVAAA